MNTTTNPTTIPEFFLGIDVGKSELFCHILSPKGTLSECFPNNSSGIKNLLSSLRKQGPLHLITVCLEQTGHYGRDLSEALFNLEIHSVHLVNPRQIKAYGNQKLRRNKSDTADAKLIAQFLQSEYSDLRPWSPRSIEHQQIKELSRYAESLTQNNGTLKTKLEAISLPPIVRSVNRRIKAQEKEIKDIRQRIEKLIAQEQDLASQKKLLLTIPGIGETSAQILLAELPDLQDFAEARQLAAWAGLTPQHYKSGTSGRSTTPITKVGSVHLRSALFMPAMSARTHNPLLKEFADRLIENNKTGKQTIVAVMRKLLHQIFGILKSGLPFNPEKRGFQSTPQPLNPST